MDIYISPDSELLNTTVAHSISIWFYWLPLHFL